MNSFKGACNSGHDALFRDTPDNDDEDEDDDAYLLQLCRSLESYPPLLLLHLGKSINFD